MSDADIRIAIVDYAVDAASRARFRSALAPLRSAAVAIVDLSCARYIDSTGVTELLLLHRAREHRGRDALRLVVGEPSGTVARIVDLAGLEEVYSVFRTLKEARK